MATFSKMKLSGSTDGKGIQVTGINTAQAVTVHTASNVASTYDEVWLYATNVDSTDRKLTIEWGGSGTADIIEYTVKAENGLYLMVPRIGFAREFNNSGDSQSICRNSKYDKYYRIHKQN